MHLASALSAQVPDERRGSPFAYLQARAQLELADSSYSRIRQLYTRNMVSPAELEASRAERERAMLEVLELWVETAGTLPNLKVLRAVKARSADGSTVVRLRVSTAGDELLGTILRDALPSQLRERLGSESPPNAYISVKDEPGAAGTAIGVPYEHRVALDAQLREIEFRLLRDVDAVVVSLASGGLVEERRVWLEADVSGAITIQPLPFSQEVDLGAEAQYELTIERMSADEQPLRLALSGLPASIAYHFTDSESNARIGQLRFAPDERRRSVRLSLSIPAAQPGGPEPDSTYRFLMLATPPEAELPGAHDVEWWRARGAGAVELEVVPRGVGRAELRAFNLFHEATEGESVSFEVVVRNAGSRSLDQVRVASDLPPGWSGSADPSEIMDVAPGEERSVRLVLTPASDAELGDYEARLRLEGYSGRTKLAVEPTVLRVRVHGRSGGLTTVLLLVALLAGVAATVVFTRRLSTR